MTEKTSTRVWAGRFAETTDAFVQAFTASEGFDRRLYREDIQGSKAHAGMLRHAGILSAEEYRAVIAGLDEIEAEITCGEFPWSASLEDVHMNIEVRLTERIGEAGKKLHTGRSRNDQIATDMRLWLRGTIDRISERLREFQACLVDLAEREAETLMPGFTHLQVAQPITFGHHMLAWYEMLVRDEERLDDCRRRVNVMPLGSAALAGTTFSLERGQACAELGFERPSENSLDAVSDRDFVIEFVAAGALIMTHLSRMAEELILWVSPLFGFVELPDRYCTGSSIMPQKKNPDVAELVRGKTARVYGYLQALLTLMKGQPLAYNRDNQEDKEPLFDTADTLLACIRAFTAMVSALVVHRERTYETARKGFATATDLADYLVRKQVPFREAHEIVGKAVRYGVEQNRDLAAMSLTELRRFSAAIEEDVFGVLSLEGSVAARDHLGGTAPSQVRVQIRKARARLGQTLGPAGHGP